MSEAIHSLFSSIAPHYDRLNTLLSLGIDRQWRRRAVAFLKDCRKVLDVCAGTLALTRELLKINPKVKITAVDFSQEMLEWGVKRLGPVANNIEIECVDFFKFARPPSSFDGVMCAYGMRNLDDNRLALKKIRDLLSSQGRLVILEFFRPDRWYSWAFYVTYAQWVIPTLGRIISRHREAYRHLRDSIRQFYTLDQYASLLQEAGFRVLTAERLTGGISGLIVAEKTSPLPSP